MLMARPPHVDDAIRVVQDGPGDRRRIAVIDANPVLGQMLSDALSKGADLTATSHTVGRADIVALVGDIQPDVVVMDPTEIGLSAEVDLNDLSRGIQRVSGKTRILCYSFDHSDVLVRGVVDAHLHGCVSKKSGLDHLRLAVAALLGGGIYFDPNYVGEVWRLPTASASPSDGLSERERVVVKQTALGHGAKQIALGLGISAKTVDTYRARAQRKLGIADRAGLVDYAMSQGWMS